MLPLLIFVSFPAHIANELPDYHLDLEFNRRNFAVFLGKKISTILYWLGVFLVGVINVIVYFLYDLSTWTFIVIISSSLVIGLTAFILLWKNKWNTNLLVFNLVTACIGVQVLGFFIMLGL